MNSYLYNTWESIVHKKANMQQKQVTSYKVDGMSYN